MYPELDDTDDGSVPRRRLQGPGEAEPGEPVPLVPFVILCHPRSGSSMLEHAIRSHPNIRMFGEVFQSELAARAESFWPREEVYEDGEDAGEFLANALFRPRPDRRVFAVGFKLHDTQARRDAGAARAWAYLRAHREVRILHLVRENLFEAYVSLVEARESGQWALDRGAPRVHAPPVTLERRDCASFLNRTVLFHEWVRRAFAHHRVLELRYERDLCDDFPGTSARIQSFLDVPPAPLEVELEKQAQAPVPARVANYDAVREWFRHTPHERWFAEGPDEPRGGAA